MFPVCYRCMESINGKWLGRAASPFGGLTGWDMRAMIVKSGDVLRQESFCMQLISEVR